MSRIGKLPITIPAGVSVDVDGQNVSVKGPKGSLNLTVADPITVTSADGSLSVARPNDERANKALHGLSRTLINNMVVGVTEGYRKTLELSGTGYRVVPKGQGIELSVGFSHPVPIDAPAGITFVVETATRFHIDGIDKQLVGETAANIRKIRPPEPYKGKGIRYSDEVIRRKAGKAGK